MTATDFSEKLKIVLKALVVSRTGLASGLNVDKSLVGRWASGAVRPSEHNLANITRYVAERIPGFTLFDWDREINDFRTLFGATAPESMQSITDWIPASFLEEANRTSAKRGANYCGLWKSTRASYDLPGRFIHDICIIQQSKDGRLRFRVGVEGVRYEGWSLLLQHQVFSVAFDQDSGTMMFSIFNGVARQKPQIVDGLNLATLRDAGGSPAASASVLERISDLTGDDEADDALFEKAIAELSPLAPEGSVDDVIAAHLLRTVQGEEAGILRLLFGESIARGATVGEIASAIRS
ncbi:MAG: hypothetical protein AAGH41_12790 [Pseudomonadota bacterium]